MNSTFVEGVVVDTNDPQQMGRVKAWCPSVDGDNYDISELPWVAYVSPFAGQVRDFPGGSSGQAGDGPTSYGIWAVPKNGAFIIVGFLYGDYNNRFYLGSYFPEHGNRSLPAGRNTASGPTTDTNDPLLPAAENLKSQFKGNLSASEAQTRGAYERQAAQAATTKDGKEGYQAGANGDGLDPQTYCIVTPGRHAIIMQDASETARVRIKTAEGSQVILDDANERIYVSTARGKTWIELDQAGYVHIYGSDSISMSTGGDFNVTAKGSFNVKAGGNVNLAATGYARISACSDLSLSADGPVAITAGAQMDLLAAANIIQTGSEIHLNGPDASEAPCADSPSVVPDHEPWTRPGSKGKRNKHWKP